jgi:hypothetical protein
MLGMGLIMKYITEEMINDFNKELEMIGSSIRYDFYADPDGFAVCDRGKFRITDEFIESTTIFKLTDKFYSFVEDTFKRKYNIDVRVCEMTGNIWVAD